jgi:hypothetical protein
MQRRDLRAKRGSAGAGWVQKAVPLLGVALERGDHQGLDALPVLGFHG